MVKITRARRTNPGGYWTWLTTWWLEPPPGRRVPPPAVDPIRHLARGPGASLTLPKDQADELLATLAGTWAYWTGDDRPPPCWTAEPVASARPPS